MTRESSRGHAGVILWAERCLWTAGVFALGYCSFLWGRAAYDQGEGNRVLNLFLSRGAHTGVGLPAPQEGQLAGRIEIPQLGMTAIVFEGTSDGTLARGVGHLTGSAAPGQQGNLVLAGHRDTFFRPLRDIRAGDLITVTNSDGPSQYVVESTEVVEPNAVEVLRASGGSTVTLITCYPFRYIGNAPQRFIVHGRKLS